MRASGCDAAFCCAGDAIGVTISNATEQSTEDSHEHCILLRKRLAGTRRLRDLYRRPGAPPGRRWARSPSVRLPLGSSAAAARNALSSPAVAGRPALPSTLVLRRGLRASLIRR